MSWGLPSTFMGTNGAGGRELKVPESYVVTMVRHHPHPQPLLPLLCSSLTWHWASGQVPGNPAHALVQGRLVVARGCQSQDGLPFRQPVLWRGAAPSARTFPGEVRVEHSLALSRPILPTQGQSVAT